MSKTYKVRLKYSHGHFNTVATMKILAKGEKSAKTRALKLAKLREREAMEVDIDSVHCSLIGE